MLEIEIRVNRALVALRRLGWVLVGWCLLLAVIAYLSIRETQRMLCHTTWPEYSSAQCSTHFTGDTLVYLVAVAAGSLTCLLLALALLPGIETTASPSGERAARE
jgi:hypothetical protein